MTTTRIWLNVCVLAACCLFAASAAQAQSLNYFTYVSAGGNDANDCTRFTPCRTFAGALAKTYDGGVIAALDPAGHYGAVTIDKSITIDGGAARGAILVDPGVNGVTVNTSNAGSKVVLRNLDIVGTGVVGGLGGIRFVAGAELTIDNCTITGVSGHGIHVNHGQSSLTKIRNVSMEDVAGKGVLAGTSSGAALVVVDNCKIRATAEGIQANNNAAITVQNTTITRASAGLRVAGSGSTINADHTLVSFSGTGAVSSAGNVISLTNCTLSDNGIGLKPNDGGIRSFGGNALIGNGTAGAFTKSFPKQ